MSGLNVFSVGKPIPRIWLSSAFDYDDMIKYMFGVIISNQEELDRLNKKYSFST